MNIGRFTREMHAHTQMHTLTHTHKQTYIHTHKHTHTHTQSKLIHGSFDIQKPTHTQLKGDGSKHTVPHAPNLFSGYRVYHENTLVSATMSKSDFK